MKKNLLLIFLFNVAFAQWQDDFSDGDFTFNPMWVGDTDSFEILTDTLHLNAPANTEESYLSTTSESAVNGFWEFDISLDFNPSSGNKAYIYLISNQENLEEGLNGYYVLVGNTDDEISLYRQDGNSSTKIIDGTDDFVNNTAVNCRIKISRDELGNWDLQADTSANFNNYESQGTTFDNTYLSSNYFGIKCDYTASRSDKFYFDNFVVTSITYVDNTAPQLLSFEVANLTTIDLFFDEKIDSIAASNIQNYNLSIIGEPSIINYQDDIIQLHFTNEMQGNFSYSLSVQNMMDTAGNELDTLVSFVINDAYEWQFAFFNEIYADETPSYGLPDAEFLEIFHNGSDTFFTKNCFLVVENDTAYFPIDTIFPASYSLLCKNTAVLNFEAYGKTIGLTGFPALSNSSDTLSLYNKYGQLIDKVIYQDDWYRNRATSNGEMKEDGGFSLERVAATSPCADFYNWYPSENIIGGTPAQENSVINLDFEQEISIVSAFPIASDTLQITFSNEFQWQTTDFTISYFIDDMGILIFPDTIISVGENQLYIVINEDFEEGISYSILVENSIDCYGNLLENLTIDFFLPEPIEEGDLLINEILFNPKSGESDFIEIYNQSSKTIDIFGLQIEKRAVFEPDSILDFVTIDFNQLMPPKSFFVFTEDSLSILSSFDVKKPQWLFEVDLPNFADKEDYVVLTHDSVKMDELHYYERWHYDLIDDKNGVSLERIDYKTSTDNNDNWTSAAASFGFGTPTAVNSQYFEPNLTGSISVRPKVFTPNQDGDKDFTTISYQLEQGGFIANVTVFDVQGRIMKPLAMNEHLGTKGHWLWDGSNQNGEKASIGIYIILIELFDLDGNKKTYKEQVVLGARL